MALDEAYVPQDLAGGGDAASAPGRFGLRRLLRTVLWAPSSIVLLLLVVCALFAPWIAPYNPVQVNLLDKLAPPSAAHWFGTDPLGMDVLSRTIYATRIDLSVAILSVLLGVGLGAPLGALAGLAGEWIDTVLSRLAEMMQAFPAILVAMLAFAAVGNNLVTLTIVLGLLNVPVYVKMVRSVAMPLRSVEFVQAAWLDGHSRLTILVKHILPNTLIPVFSQFSISCAFSIQIICGLSFLGLGVHVPTPEWGSMLNVGADYIVFGQWWPSVFPGLAIFLAAFSLTNIGNRVRKATLRQGDKSGRRL
jgi:peptide/nickel transport system permease protein